MDNKVRNERAWGKSGYTLRSKTKENDHPDHM